MSRPVLGAVQDGAVLTRADGTQTNLLDRKKTDGGCTLLVAEPFDWRPLLACVGPDDVVVASRNARMELRFACKGRVLRVAPVRSAWGLNTRSAAEVDSFITSTASILQELGLDPDAGFPASASGAAARLALKTVGKAEGFRALKPRFRTIARESLATGAVAVTYAGGRELTSSVDLSGAYLEGMRLPLPLPSAKEVAIGPWDAWAQVRGKTGFIRAIVDVPDHGYRSLGLLPVRAGKLPGVSYPVGRICGSWPISLLAQAEELGATVVQIVEGYTVDAAPIFSDLADQLEALKNRGPAEKAVAKAIYTRFWGIMFSEGRFKGRLPEAPQDGEIEEDGHLPTYDADPFYWHAAQTTVPAFDDERSIQYSADSKLQTDFTTHKAKALYRPDWAVTIASYCALSMQRAAYELRGKITAAHVDSLAFRHDEHTSTWAAQAVESGRWHHVETARRARWFSPGVAVHGDRVVQAGAERTFRSKLEFYRWASTTYPKPVLCGRVLHAKHRQNAVARPYYLSPNDLDLPELAHGVDRVSLWSPAWSTGGWLRKVPECFSNEPVLAAHPCAWGHVAPLHSYVDPAAQAAADLPERQPDVMPLADRELIYWDGVDAETRKKMEIVKIRADFKLKIPEFDVDDLDVSSGFSTSTHAGTAAPGVIKLAPVEPAQPERLFTAPVEITIEALFAELDAPGTSRTIPAPFRDVCLDDFFGTAA